MGNCTMPQLLLRLSVLLLAKLSTDTPMSATEDADFVVFDPDAVVVVALLPVDNEAVDMIAAPAPIVSVVAVTMAGGFAAAM